jgi:Fe-S cluster assembly protein SufD
MMMNCEFSNDAQVSLNRTPDGGFSLVVPANTKPSKPIYVTCLFDELNLQQIQIHNQVTVEAGSSAELLMEYQTISDKSYTLYNVTEVSLDYDATLNIVLLQRMNGDTRLTNNITVNQSASSKMKIHFISSGGSDIRNQMNVNLTGANAEHYAYGLSTTQRNEHVENDILIAHASPCCQSKQLFKHILSDTSTGAFTGRIVVSSDAQKTMAYQRSSNILLHPEAKMNIRPQLEIYADDVKCSHGATVGQLDAEALFYMRSRGISETEAKKMLLQAFADEVTDNIACKQFREKIMNYEL